jgi:hypothetical protein
MNNIPFEIFQNFNEIKYYDEPHKYFLGIDEYISVTTLIHKYQEEFDENYWSNYKANEFNVPQWKIKRAWDFINKKGTLKGSIIHDYAENALYPEYLITKKHVDNFLRLSKNKLIPIKTELVVYDKESKIAGMVDLLFYNVKENELQIYDWKTNKAFYKNNPHQNLLGNLNMLEDCDLELYSLQMEMYKYIIEKNTSLKLGKSYLIWVSHNNNNFEIIEGQNRRFFIEQIIKERKKSLK